MQPNEGRLPPETVIYDEDGNAIGHHRVHVELFNGWNSKKAGTGSWPASGGRPRNTIWAFTRGPSHNFDIKLWEIA